MRLVSVYDVFGSPAILYRLLAEREPHVNISHKTMPTPAEHMAFFCSRPYQEWLLIEVDDAYVGTIYLTPRREVGIFIFSEHQRKGYGRRAFAMLRPLLGPEPILANIASANTWSMLFFHKLGFTALQVTYVHAA